MTTRYSLMSPARTRCWQAHPMVPTCACVEHALRQAHAAQTAAAASASEVAGDAQRHGGRVAPGGREHDPCSVARRARKPLRTCTVHMLAREKHRGFITRLCTLLFRARFWTCVPRPVPRLPSSWTCFTAALA